MWFGVNKISQPALDDIPAALQAIEENAYMPTCDLLEEIGHGNYVLKNIRVAPDGLIPNKK